MTTRAKKFMMISMTELFVRSTIRFSASTRITIVIYIKPIKKATFQFSNFHM